MDMVSVHCRAIMPLGEQQYIAFVHLLSYFIGRQQYVPKLSVDQLLMQ